MYLYAPNILEPQKPRSMNKLNKSTPFPPMPEPSPNPMPHPKPDPIPDPNPETLQIHKQNQRNL